MKTYILNFKDKETPAEIHEYLKEMLELPNYYGRNLDALYDCLTSITAPTGIAIANIDTNNEFQRRLLNVMRDAADDNQRLKLLPKPEGWVR